MKKLKLIASLLLVVSVLALNSIGASAKWKQDSNGVWIQTKQNSLLISDENKKVITQKLSSETKKISDLVGIKLDDITKIVFYD